MELWKKQRRELITDKQKRAVLIIKELLNEMHKGY